jgi:hypothetical protein
MTLTGAANPAFGPFGHSLHTANRGGVVDFCLVISGPRGRGSEGAARQSQGDQGTGKQANEVLHGVFLFEEKWNN